MAKPAMGTVTFLFSDIEGSTLLWEMHRQAMERRHDTILRETIEGQGGYSSRPWAMRSVLRLIAPWLL
jgi:class 3 adenylate cyclase